MNNPLMSEMIFDPSDEAGPAHATAFRPRDFDFAPGQTGHFVQARVEGRWHTCGYARGVAGFKTSTKRNLFLAQLRQGHGCGHLEPQAGGPACTSTPAQRREFFRNLVEMGVVSLPTPGETIQ